MQKGVGLPDGHIARSESADGFQNFPAAHGSLPGWAVRKDRDDHNVTIALRYRHADFTVHGILRPVAVVGILPRAQVAGEGIERFQKSVHGAGCHYGHVGVIHVIFLNVLQHLAEYAQGAVRLVVRGLAEHITQSDV